MGASASVNTIVTDINNRVETSLKQTAEASADAECTVTIGSIKFEETVGCGINVSNLCSAKTEAQVNAVVEATISFYNSLSNEQKQEAPAWFTAAFGINTTVNTIVNDYKNFIEQKCLAKSVVDSDITINDITISKCKAPPNEGIIEFKFYNAGKATGQCAVGALVDLQVAGSNIIANSQSQGLDWSSIIWPIVTIAIIILIIFLLYYIKGLFIMKPEDKVKLELAKNNNMYSGLILLDDYVKKKKIDTDINV